MIYADLTYVVHEVRSNPAHAKPAYAAPKIVLEFIVCATHPRRVKTRTLKTEGCGTPPVFFCSTRQIMLDRLCDAVVLLQSVRVYRTPRIHKKAT